MPVDAHTELAITMLQCRINDLDCVKMDLNLQDIATNNIDNQIDYLKAHIRNLQT